MEHLPLTTVVIGERRNAVSGPVDPAFESGPSAARLRSLGLRWDAARNLLPPAPSGTAAWSRADASTAAARIARDYPDGATLVLCGRRVAEAFGLAAEPPLTRRVIWDLGGHPGLDVLLLPHPSGLSRWWNDPENFEAARRACAELREVALCRR